MFKATIVQCFDARMLTQFTLLGSPQLEIAFFLFGNTSASTRTKRTAQLYQKSVLEEILLLPVDLHTADMFLMYELNEKGERVYTLKVRFK